MAAATYIVCIQLLYLYITFMILLFDFEILAPYQLYPLSLS